MIPEDDDPYYTCPECEKRKGRDLSVYIVAMFLGMFTYFVTGAYTKILVAMWEAM